MTGPDRTDPSVDAVSATRVVMVSCSPPDWEIEVAFASWVSPYEARELLRAAQAKLRTDYDYEDEPDQ